MLYAIWTLLWIALDRLTKLWAERRLSRLPGGASEALPGIFRFRYAQNTGVAFSMLSGGRWLIVALNALLILALIAYFFFGKFKGRLFRIGLCMIVAGGIGNLIDRVVLGYVIDFIEPTFMRFAVFNLADACVTVGAFLCALDLARKGGGA